MEKPNGLETENTPGSQIISLTQTGEIQAAALARRIEQIKFSHIFSSPLKRAKETCTICGFDPKIDKDLLEWDYGAYEGLTSEEILKTMPDWKIFTYGAPGGEMISSLHEESSYS